MNNDESGKREEERDGCKCPPWVIRCVHFNDESLFLTDHYLCQGEGFKLMPRYLGGRHHNRSTSNIAVSYFCDCDDYDTAFAAFREAEEVLIRGSQDE